MRFRGRSKYNNKIVEYDKQVFDSKKERDRYIQLKYLSNDKIITNLRRQVKFKLVDAQYKGGKCVERGVTYIADFVYEQHGKTVVEDVKGVRTQVYIIKRKLMLERYGIEIKEI